VSSQGGFESDEWNQAAPIRQPGRERLVKAESQFVFSVVADERQIANLVDGLSDAELAIAPIVEQLTAT
jgi:hypothetical protein